MTFRVRRREADEKIWAVWGTDTLRGAAILSRPTDDVFLC